MTNKTIILTLMGSMLLMVSCMKTSVVHPYDDSNDSTDPMIFSTASESLQQVSTKATLLQDGFVVSCWKHFGSDRQQIVMDNYEVKYNVNTWYNTSNWDYVSGKGNDPFYKTQYQRYWDYSAFPYQFSAVTPCPISGGALKQGFSLTTDGVTLPSDAVFTYQTGINGYVSPGSEPYMLAQIRRNPDGKDYDILSNNSNNQINSAAGISLSRKVALPFHHITSKVRFGIYTNDLGELDSPIIVTDAVIKVTSPRFVTSASGYMSNSGELIPGTFSGFTTSVNPSETLLSIGSSGLNGNDISKCTGPSSAYFLECPAGLTQIPQQGVTLSVSFSVAGRMVDDQGYSTQITYDPDTHTTRYQDIPLVLRVDDTVIQNRFNWESGYIYTYYIIISRFSLHPIEFTAVLTEWVDVYGELSTDLEK